MAHARARATLAGLLAAATASTAVLTGGPAAAAPTAGPQAATATPGATDEVTLVTGDVVTLGGPRGVDVAAARGREHVGFHGYTDVDGDVHVIPEDALSLVTAGRLDPRLFDVTRLARTGYGDRADLPLIVDYPGATPRAAGARAVRELPSVSAVAMRAEKSPAFWAAARTSADRIWLDAPVRASLAHSVPQIGAPAAWAGGHTGTGTTVAVLDTGIDVTHPDLADAVTESRDFTESEFGADDRLGHGTHVASIITGAGEVHKGVAPDAKLLNAKVLDDSGFGSESSIIAGMEWAAGKADVVNVSIGSDWATDGTDPVAQAVNRLTAGTGTLFVAAAGNSGPGSELVSSPASADAALAVGAVDRADRLAEFSSRGPRVGDGAIKPDITAPGVDIVAAKAAHGWIGTPAGDGYVSLSGTSMAAPHVAGAAAILAGQHPDWPADRLKSTLMSTAKPNPDLSVYEQGTGRVDVAAAMANVAASPGSLSLGTAQWPHHDDQPVARTITYTNPGAEPVTMDVAADLTGPDGKAAPAGMFTVAPARVTVPAGGSAAVTMTTDTRVEAADGQYTGVVVATGGGTTTRTPVAVNREVESYDVKLTFLDHNGKPTPNYSFRFVNMNKPEEYRNHDESGTVVARVPKGTHYFSAWVQTPLDADRLLTADVKEPALVVAGPASYTFDARAGVEPGVTLDEPAARLFSTMFYNDMATEWGDVGDFHVDSNFEGFSSRPSRTRAPGYYKLYIGAMLAKPDGTGTGPGFHASPYLYHIWHTDDSGGVPADLTPEIADEQLAKVVSSHAVATPGMIGIREGALTMPLPYTLTEYYTPGVEWAPHFREATSWDGASGLAGEVGDTPRVYELGETVTERWNAGPFGPSFPSGPGVDFARRGDELRFEAGLHGDQNADTAGYADAVGATQLVRAGVVIAESPYPGGVRATTMAPEEATYTVRTTATRPGPPSTRVDAEWTFRSAHVEGEVPVAVPALAVRFAPKLDDHNAAPAGRKFRFPVHVQRNGAEQPGAVNTPAVEISYDDGRTWQKVRLTRHSGQWQAEVTHPRNAKSASLRWSVSDQAGNTAKATIIHAYTLKK